jgi:hypothetical protein
MFVGSKSSKMTFVVLCSLVGLLPITASAITVEVAKKCNVLLAKEFPPRERGNPAAGSTKGTAQSQRDYFNRCVANGGNMDGDDAKSQK